MIPSAGLTGLIHDFGDPRPFITRKKVWENQILKAKTLPFDLPYAYMPVTKVSSIMAHKLLVDLFADCLKQCIDKGVPAKRLVYGGIYAFRAKRSEARLSVHAWGAAIDIDPAKNPQGVRWKDDGVMLDPRIIEVFKANGFIWGGDFSGRLDPMHFQMCKGY